MTEDQPCTGTEDRLGFLLARHGQVMNTRLRQALARSGLSPRHGAALSQLSARGPVSQQALSEALAVDASALVALLNDLERHGQVARRRDPADRRRHIVEITPAGVKALAAMDAAISAVEHEALRNLDPDEVAQLHALLARVNSTGCRAGAGPAGDTGPCA